MGAIGFAYKATGGAGGAVITVKNAAASGSGTLAAAIERVNGGTTPTIIRIAAGVQVEPVELIVTASNLTIEGADETHLLRNVSLEFDFSRGTNVVLSNLNFRSDEACSANAKHRDCIKIVAEAMKTTRQAIWIDHCQFAAYYDMCITSNSKAVEGKGPLLITVSNCRFEDDDPTNVNARNHGAIGIHGVGADDSGNTLATICNNVFQNVRRRSPRSSNGCFTHAYNNVLQQWGASGSADQVNGMDAGNGGKLVVQANWFQAGVFKESVHCDSSGAILTLGADELKNVYRNDAVVPDAVGSAIDVAAVYRGVGAPVPAPQPMTRAVKDAIVAGAGPA